MGSAAGPRVERRFVSLFWGQRPGPCAATTCTSTVAVPSIGRSARAGNTRPFGTHASPASSAYMTVTPGPDGGFTVETPLPGVAGVVRLALPGTATVADFRAAIAGAGGSSSAGSDVLVLTPSGDAVSAASQLRLFLLDDFRVKIGGLNLTPVYDAVSTDAAAFDLAEARGADKGYVFLKRALLAHTGPTLPHQEFLALAHKCAADQGVPQDLFNPLLASWTTLLHQENVLLHFNLSADPAVRDVVFLRPILGHKDLSDALDFHGAKLASSIAKLEEELAHVQDSLVHMTAFESTAKATAARRVRAIAVGTGMFLLVQFAGIFQLVYTHSWDIMEPVCYFIGTTYGILFYFYFMRTRLDPRAGNFFKRMFLNAVDKYHARNGPPGRSSAAAFDLARAAAQEQAVALEKRLAQLRRSAVKP